MYCTCTCTAKLDWRGDRLDYAEADNGEELIKFNGSGAS